MHTVGTNSGTKNSLKRSRSKSLDMPATITMISQKVNNEDDDCSLFSVEEIVQYPLPGYVAPTSVSFSPDDDMITYLFSPDHSLSRKVFCFNMESGNHDLVFSPADGGLDESNISEEEKLRRERARERGLGVTRYEWVKMLPSKKKMIMVPLPDGVCFLIVSFIMFLLFFV